MEALTAQDFGFQLYYRLLTSFDKTVSEVLIFDAEARLRWQSHSLGIDSLAELKSKIPNVGTGQPESIKPGDLRFVVQERSFELIRLQGKEGRVILSLCIGLKDRTESVVKAFHAEVVDLLNQGLLEWYSASLRFASQEEELNAMTDELTRRYEELNLIYKADDQAENFYHGRELLSQLVQKTPGIINVDLAVMVLPGKNLTIYKCKNDNKVSDSETLIGCIRDHLFTALTNAGSSLVINHQEDARRYNVKLKLPYKLTASPLVNAEGEIIGVLALIKKQQHQDFDNSDRNLLDVLANKASKIVQFNFDRLTGLENSSSFELVITEALKQAKRADCCHSIANIDIDGMAIINGIAGREGGDRLIKEIGGRIEGIVRSGDSVARLGADKFGVYLQNCDLIQAKQVMQKISNEISEIKFEWDDKLHEVSISIGLAAINAESESITSVMNAAESARIEGKQIGPNRISVYEIAGSDAGDMKQQTEWLGRIQAALKSDGYLLYGQVIESIQASSKEMHFEVLLRMRDENDLVIPPGEFLPVAEKFQLMPKIDYWVIEKSLATYSEVFSGLEEPLCPISINLSGQSLSDPVELGNYIEEQFRHYAIDPSNICFEVTESAAITNLESAKQFINRMRSIGCQFSLDDFGTGLSSFAYLKNLNVDFIKIDGSFVHNIISDPVSESMVSAINQVGHAMGLKTVAEFVENSAIKKRLDEIGVDFVQGYGIGKPAPLVAQLKQVREAHEEILRKAQG